MKFKMIVAAAALVLLGFSVNAQSFNEPPVKILPTATPGVIKVLYADDLTTGPLVVKFLTNNKVVNKDKIKGIYPTGVSKRYDVSLISHNDFKIEISSPKMTVTYHLVPSGDKYQFLAQLENTSYNQVIVRKE